MLGTTSSGISYEPRYMQVWLECQHILLESSQWENRNDLFCRKVSFLTDRHCIVLDVFQGMRKV